MWGWLFGLLICSLVVLLGVFVLMGGDFVLLSVFVLFGGVIVEG